MSGLPGPTIFVMGLYNSRPEGNDRGSTLSFYVIRETRTGETWPEQTVNWSISGSGENPADADDFVDRVLPSGIIGFIPGAVSTIIDIQVLGDYRFEPDETFTFILSGQNIGTIGQATAVGTILNDDSLPLPPPAPPGEQVLTGAEEADVLVGGLGRDTLQGLSGDDTVSGLQGNDLILGNQGDDLLFGNQGQDTLFGGQGADSLYGGQDADLLLGNLGSDILLGNMGADTLYGGQGADSLYGGQGNDVLFGDLGDDVLYGDLGNDVLRGGAGADRYVFNVNSGNDVVLGFNAAEGDRLDLRGQTYTFGTAADGSGSALLVLSGGGTIELAGVTQGQVNAGFFAA